MTSLVTYNCPSCGVLLEAENDGWQDWRLCPSCGRAGRPTYIRPVTQVYMEEILYIGTFPEAATSPAPAPSSPPPSSPAPNSVHQANPVNRVNVVEHPTPQTFDGYPPTPAGPQRLILGGGFFFAVVLTLISLVQHNTGQAGILALVSVFLLVLFSAIIKLSLSWLEIRRGPSTARR